MTVRAVLVRTGAFAVVAVAFAVEMLGKEPQAVLRDGTVLPGWVVPAAMASAYATLLIRDRYPLRVYVGQWFFSLAGLIVPHFDPFAGLLVALNSVAARLPLRMSSICLAVAVIPLAIDATNGARDRRNVETSYVASFVVQLLLFLVVTVAAWGVGRAVIIAREHADAQREERAAAAVREERLRMARELHDTVSYGISTMVLQAAAARAMLGDDELLMIRTLSAIESAGLQSMGELRQMLGLLRSQSPDVRAEVGPETSRSGRIDDISRLVDQVRPVVGGIRYHVDGSPGHVDRSVDLTVYRIVQESLTNVVKHAGSSGSVLVILRWSPERLEVIVEDHVASRRRGARRSALNTNNLVTTGELSARLSTGNGLRGLQERVDLVGGELDVVKGVDGFKVHAKLPATTATVIPAAVA